ncbi:hypothetical protein ACS0TY_018332 [Phlomoides rotata]
MANARLARFISEVAPPQLVSVMRRRGSKMLDTIHEEEREREATTKFPISHSAAASSNYNAITTQHLFIKNVRIFFVFEEFANGYGSQEGSQ